MPELPEVETVKRALDKAITGKKIQSVTVSYPKIVHGDAKLLASCLKGEKIQMMQRRGKYLIVVTQQYAVISHLRMSGKYFVTNTPEPISKHVHMIWAFEDGSYLQYEDVRKFGRVEIISADNIEAYFHAKKIGMEPTEDLLDIERLMNMLKGSKQQIKAALLGQKIVAGLGNIYVDEVLYKSKIHPLKYAADLTRAEVKVLRQHIIQTIEIAIACGGTTIRDYTSLGEQGKFQMQLMVYGQQGKPCQRCGTVITKMVVAQRGTHICLTCQRGV